MKAYLKNQFKGYTGKIDGCVAYYHPLRDVLIMRKLPEFIPNSRTEKLKEIMQNLGSIAPSQAYKQDFRDYLNLYNQLAVNRNNRLISWSNLYLKMLYAMQKAIPGVDLRTLSRSQIETQGLPCRTVSSAVQAGLLPPVSGYERFNKLI